MNCEFIRSPGKKELIAQLEEQFGITELPYLLLETGKEKIRGFSGSMTKAEIISLSRLINVEIIGLYLFKKEEGSKRMRLSLDATHLLSSQLTKNVIEITDEQKEIWLRGNNLDIKTNSGMVLVKNKNIFLGCGLSTGKNIINHIPKERRIRFSAEKYKIRDALRKEQHVQP